MFDELERLRDTATLQELLGHYAQAGAVDRERWQDRRMQVTGVEAKELTTLHGELLAYGWVEQNTGHTASAQAGVVACCYRVTPAGLRAWQHAQSGPAGKDTEETAVPEASGPGGTLPVAARAPGPKRRRARQPPATEDNHAAAPLQPCTEPS
jgi:hypothetical protein